MPSRPSEAAAEPLKRPAFYGRISVFKEASDYRHDGVEASVDRQFREYTSRAEREGWAPPRVYRDEGISAFSGKRRPEFERLLGDIEAGLVDLVVVWKLDRLCRRSRDFVRIWEVCRAHGVDLVSLTEPFDTTTPIGKAMAQIGVIFAEMGSEDTSIRVKAWYAALERNGQRPLVGRRPFGWEPDRVTPRAAEADRLYDAARRVVEGGSLRAITQEWNDADITTTTTTGHRWHQVMVRGRLLAAHNEPLLGAELAKEVRRVLTDPLRRTQRGTARRHLLSGLLVCPLCERRMTGYVDKGHPTPQRAYHCPAPPAGCGRLSRLAEPLERLVVEVVCRLIEAGDAVLEAGADASEEADRALHARWQELAANLRRYDLDYRAGELPARDRNRFKAEDEAEIEEIKRRLQRRHRRRGRNTRPERGQVLRQGMGLAEGTLWSLEDRRALVSAHLQHITVRPAVRGRHTFDPGAVEPVWQEELNKEAAEAIWQALVAETLAAQVRTHCKHGHLLDEANRCIRGAHGRTYVACRQCERDSARRHYRRRTEGQPRHRSGPPRGTHCKSGRHEFTPENTRVRRDGSRSCRECRNLRRRKGLGGQTTAN